MSDKSYYSRMNHKGEFEVRHDPDHARLKWKSLGQPVVTCGENRAAYIDGHRAIFGGREAKRDADKMCEMLNDLVDLEVRMDALREHRYEPPLLAADHVVSSMGSLRGAIVWNAGVLLEGRSRSRPPEIYREFRDVLCAPRQRLQEEDDEV